MARITIEDCLKKVASRFELVHLAAHRVRQIREGSEYLVSSPKNEDIVVALREIAAGKVTQESIDAAGDMLMGDAGDVSPPAVMDTDIADIISEKSDTPFEDENDDDETGDSAGDYYDGEIEDGDEEEEVDEEEDF